MMSMLKTGIIAGLAAGLQLLLLTACGGTGTQGDALDGDADPAVEGVDGTDGADLPPDHGTDMQDADGADSPPDPATDVEDEDVPTGCVYNDTVDHDSYCRVMQMDVARNIPGGLDRTLYTFQIDYPGGDYDRECLVMDEFTVSMGGGVIRTAAASFDAEADRFFMDDTATPGELQACDGDGRANLFVVSYRGRSPAGSFHGECDTSHWTPQTTLACHSGVEAGLSTFDGTTYVDSSFTAPYLDFNGSFGNHGPDALTSFTLDSITWNNIDNPSESLPLTSPVWTSSGFYHVHPLWSDRVDPDTWQPVTFNVGATEAVAMGGLCTAMDDPFSATATHIVLSGSHSAGTFTVETHPVYCLIMTTP
jgi:hypothetical protein